MRQAKWYQKRCSGIDTHFGFQVLFLEDPILAAQVHWSFFQNAHRNGLQRFQKWGSVVGHILKNNLAWSQARREPKARNATQKKEKKAGLNESDKNISHSKRKICAIETKKKQIHICDANFQSTWDWQGLDWKWPGPFRALCWGRSNGPALFGSLSGLRLDWSGPTSVWVLQRNYNRSGVRGIPSTSAGCKNSCSRGDNQLFSPNACPTFKLSSIPHTVWLDNAYNTPDGSITFGRIYITPSGNARNFYTILPEQRKI